MDFPRLGVVLSSLLCLSLSLFQSCFFFSAVTSPEVDRRASSAAVFLRIFLHYRSALAQKLHLCNHVVDTVGSCQGRLCHGLVFCHLWLLRPPGSLSWIDPIQRNPHTSSNLPPAPKGLIVKPVLERLPPKSVHNGSSLFEVLDIMNSLCVTNITTSFANVVYRPTGIFPMTPLQTTWAGESSKLRARLCLVCWKVASSAKLHLRFSLIFNFHVECRLLLHGSDALFLPSTDLESIFCRVDVQASSSRFTGRRRASLSCGMP